MRKVTALLQKLAVFPYLVLFLTAGQVALWAADRSPPFTMLDYRSTAATNEGTVFISADVQRQLYRNCNVEFSRHMFDSRGYRWDLTGLQAMSKSALDKMDDLQPDKLLVAILVPPAAAPGTAKLVTVLNYECNPIHKLWPIQVTLTMNFEVLK